ncbi:MAG: hypothetical protein AB7F99_14815 [Vicinamibacterales bacterium]
MLKQLVKLALAALIANVVWRVGSEYVTHLRFRESVRAATVDHASTDESLKAAILEEADRLDVPIAVEDLEIARAERRIGIAGTYTKTIELVPGYEYPWDFDWEVEVFVAPSVNQVPLR